MNYTEVYFKAAPELVEILLAELGDLPYDSFEESADGLKAYVPEDQYDEAPIRELVAQYEGLGTITYQVQTIPKVNWNEEWEKNFHPIAIADQIYVRADFHEAKPAVAHEIIIVPKMSFGTGHHDTTSQMLQLQLNLDHKDKAVLDAGTGTGILAIMADQKGAGKILANDIDDWCIDNSRENFALNNCREITLERGTVSVFEGEQVDILLANINKNVLLEEIPQYAKLVKAGGTLLLSGFYEADIPDLETKLKHSGFNIEQRSVQNRWAALQCAKAVK